MYDVIIKDAFDYDDLGQVSASCQTEEDAIKICKTIVDNYLTQGRCLTNSPDELFQQYMGMGEHPIINPSVLGFSHDEYAKERCNEIYSEY
jgi:hypothetical protein